jgi:hypothetical protein
VHTLLVAGLLVVDLVSDYQPVRRMPRPTVSTRRKSVSKVVALP